MCLRRCVLVTNIHKLDSQLARYFDDGCANFLDSLRPAANTKKLWRQNGCWRRVYKTLAKVGAQQMVTIGHPGAERCMVGGTAAKNIRNLETGLRGWGRSSCER